METGRVFSNGSKTNFALSNSWRNTKTRHLNFRTSRQKIILTNTVKYLRILLQEDSHWNANLLILAKALGKSVGFLSPIIHIPKCYLRGLLIYLQFTYNLLLWDVGQTNQCSLIKNCKKLQEKALRIVNSRFPGCYTNPLFKANKILWMTVREWICGMNMWLNEYTEKIHS